MTLKSRLLATALAISLSTPAAAVTITFGSAIQNYQINGPATFIDGFLPVVESVTLLPALPPLAPGDRGYFEYWVDVQQLSFPGYGYIIASACYSNTFCPREISMPGETSFHVGEIIRFMYIGGNGEGVWAGYRPELQLDLRMPEGVTLSHLPLPASWALLASMLGLGGLFRWAKHRLP